MAKKKAAKKKKVAKKPTKKKAAKKKTAKRKAGNRPNSESRRFELSSGTSNKFWEIYQNGKEYTVRFGRIGTNGQTPKTKQLDTLDSVSLAIDNLINEKIKKGYVEVAVGKKEGAQNISESRHTSRSKKASGRVRLQNIRFKNNWIQFFR